MRRFMVPAAVIAFLPAAASAANITISTSGATVFTTAITQFATTGSAMIGTQVSVNGGASLSWADLGGGLFGVESGGFRVSVPGGTDTFDDNAWTLVVPTGFTLNTLLFNGVAGRTTFDRTNPSPGTTDSERGKDFAGFAAFGGDIHVEYQNPLALGAGPPVGDEYVRMLLTFTGLVAPRTYSFTQDTDNALTEIRPDPVVPEPASLLLLGSGLLTASVVRRRRGGHTTR